MPGPAPTLRNFHVSSYMGRVENKVSMARGGVEHGVSGGWLVGSSSRIW